MSTINKLKSQIENANALGRANLAEKGVELPESATTYEIMQGIANALSGGGNKPQLTTEGSVAQVTLPVIVPTAIAEIKGSTLMARAGKFIGNYNVSIKGGNTIGSVLCVESDDFDVSQCSYSWVKGTPHQVIKYSHTPNINDDGTQNGNYANNYSKTEVITIDGAESLNVTLKYGTEGVSYDYISVFAGKHSDYTASSSGYLKKLGGADGEETFSVEGNSVTFAFRSDGSSVGSGYGYYAVVSGEGLSFTEVSTENTYTIVGDENKIYCELEGAGDLLGTVKTEYISIGV